MTKDVNDVEKVVLRALARRLGNDRFDVWFGNRIRLQFRKDELEVLAHSRFYADRLSSMFGTIIAETACEAIGASCRVRFSIDPTATTSHESDSEQPTEASQPARTAKTPDDTSSPSSPFGHRRRFQSLSSFVVADGNRVAWTAAKTVLTQPGDFSPLFVWGPPGTGKTHLLEGIWTELKRQQSCHVLYLTAEQFTTMFLQALHGRGLPSFRHKCRTVDVLLIDDVQFFCKKRATVVELQHTLDSLAREGRQLVLTADRAPSDLAGLGNELVTRLGGGLVCGLQLPSEQARIGIAERYLHERIIDRSHLNASPAGQQTNHSETLQAIAKAIAAQIPGDGRQLRGAVNKVLATARAQGRPLTVSLVHHSLAEMATTMRQAIGLEEIGQAVCEVFGLKADSLQSDKRSKNVSQPRMLAMWLARKYTPAVFAEIGDFFGHRSHSTVIAAEKKVGQWVQDDARVNLGGMDCHIQEAIRRVESQLRLA